MKEWLKKYFIPTEGNEHKPHILRHEAATLIFLLVIVIELGFLAQVFLVFDKTKFLAAVLPGVLTSLANEEREVLDLPPLAENELLNEAARLKAEDMAAKGYFAHTSPEGITPWHWLDVVGYQYKAAGENLAVNFSESVDVSNAWMNSPTHRANIVKADFKEIGIGVARGVYHGRNTTFVAQFFGTPVAIAATAPVPLAQPPAPAPSPIPQPAPAPAPQPAPATPQTTVLGEAEVTPPLLSKNISIGNKIKTFAEKVLTSPFESAAYAYSALGLFILLALLLAIFIKSEIQHPAVIARGAFLIGVIILLFYVNMKVVSPGVEVPAGSVTATIIIAQ